MSWQSGVAMAAIFQAIVLASLLLKERSRRSDPWLGWALLVLAGMMVVYPLGWQGRNEVPAWLAFLPINLPLALGPAIYLYTLEVAQAKRPATIWLHAVPPLIQFAYLLALSLLPGDLRQHWKDTFSDPFAKPFIELTVLLSLGGYTLAALRALVRFNARLQAERSDADLYDFRWLRRLLTTLIGSLGALCLLRFYTTFVGELDASSYILWLAGWSAALGVEGWRASGRWTPVVADPDHGAASPVLSRDWAALGEEWRERTRTAGWWRQADLSLAKLAQLLGTNQLYLSRAINEGLGLNFNEMINRLRAEAVAEVLSARGDRRDLLSIAFEAGFSSKATFNRAFRAVQGVSPSEYRRLKS